MARERYFTMYQIHLRVVAERPYDRCQVAFRLSTTQGDSIGPYFLKQAQARGTSNFSNSIRHKPTALAERWGYFCRSRGEHLCTPVEQESATTGPVRQ